MLFTDLMIGTYDRAFQKAPDVLNGVGMDVTTDPFLDVVVHGLMFRVVVSDSRITGPGIRVDVSGFGVGVLFDEPESWLPSGNLFLDGFYYERIKGLKSGGAKARIESATHGPSPKNLFRKEESRWC